MTSLIRVRDLLALRGRMETTQMSQTLNTPQSMINAILQQLGSMGRAVRIQEESDGCLSGSYKSYPGGKICLCEWRVLRQPYSIACLGEPDVRLHLGFSACSFL